MTQEQFLTAALDAAKKAGVAQAEAYYQQAQSLRVLVSKGEVEEYAVQSAGGVSLRGLVNGKMGAAFTEALDEAAIGMLVRNITESAALITDEDEQFIFEGSPAYEAVDCQGDPGTPGEAIAFALDLDRIGRSLDPRVKDLGWTGFQSERETVRILNTRGLDLSHTSEICGGVVEAVAREGERTATCFFQRCAYGFGNLSAEAMAREAVEEATFRLGASPCCSGAMPVIFRNTAMAALLETFSGVFSADAAQKGLSLLAGKEGEPIAAKGVTLIDDPLLKGGFATRPFDAEGVASRTKRVIADGVLTTLLHNLKTAKKAGCQSTGNAARAGYAGQVSVSPGNFFFQPGEMGLPALESAMGTGLVVTDVQGLHAGANPISGDFSLLATGYLVEGGGRGQAVEQVTVAGNFFRLLRDVQALGNDLRLLYGAVSCPSVWVGELSVAGK